MDQGLQQASWVMPHPALPTNKDFVKKIHNINSSGYCEVERTACKTEKQVSGSKIQGGKGQATLANGEERRLPVAMARSAGAAGSHCHLEVSYRQSGRRANLSLWLTRKGRASQLKGIRQGQTQDQESPAHNVQSYECVRGFQ